MAWKVELTNSEVDAEKVTITFKILDEGNKTLFENQQIQFSDSRDLSEEIVNLRMLERAKQLENAKAFNDKLKAKIGAKFERIA